ncbi:MAG: flavodoxin family protein [Clostridiales bacterium]|nr:flavodoxin family protein [Clostridiales bacterium]
MKTLILNGSPRRNGDTAGLLEIVRKNLPGEIMTVDAYFCNISPCIDCRFCRENRGCALHDEMDGVYDFIRGCDNVLIASPVYFSELTGKLLDLGSRFQTFFSAKFFRKEKPDISPKRGAVILCGGGDGSPDKAFSSAVCLFRQINAFDVYPMVGSFHTDSVPAVSDEKAAAGAKAIADFFCGKKNT